MIAYERLKAAVDGAAPKLFKEYVTDVKSLDGADQQYRFTITTESADRDRDVISSAGWDLKNFLRNPVVLWAHDYRVPPVAIARSVEVAGGGLASVADFSETSKIHDLARTVDALIRIGALRATSVGFRPVKWNFNEERRGVDFQEQELLEFSIVPIPANAECLIEARSAGIDVEPMREWAVKTLESLGEKDIAALPPQFAALSQAIKSLEARIVTYSLPAERKDVADPVLAEPSPAAPEAPPAEAKAPEGVPEHMRPCAEHLTAAMDHMGHASGRLARAAHEAHSAGEHDRADAMHGIHAKMQQVSKMAGDCMGEMSGRDGEPGAGEGGGESMKAEVPDPAISPEPATKNIGDIDIEKIEDIDLDAIESGVTREDMAFALREFLAGGVGEAVERAIARARGRVD